MGAYECWEEQKPKLQSSIQEVEGAAGLAYALRHTLAQVEQNTLAEQPDDLLRQQTGVLFGCCKAAANLLDVPVAAKVWVAQAQPEKSASRGPGALWLSAALLQLLAVGYCYLRGQLLTGGLLLIALGMALVAFIGGARKRKKKAEAPPQSRVTLRPDQEKLFLEVDAQMRAVDRYVNDFDYLNQQLRGQPQGALDGKTVGLVADMLEALYEHDEDGQGFAVEAVDRMLQSLGLQLVQYTPDTRQLFTVLPSKTATRTMVPALLAREDQRLLRRGTAAVQLRDGQEAKG